MNTRDQYREEYLQLFDFDQQIRAVCEMKCKVTVAESITFESDGRVHPFHGLRKDPVHFFVEVEGQYCLIRADVCVMSCRGLIWAMCAMNIPDYEPTPVEVQAIEMAAFEMGCRDVDEIDFHVTTVDIVPRDEVERDKSIHLH